MYWQNRTLSLERECFGPFYVTPGRQYKPRVDLAEAFRYNSANLSVPANNENLFVQ